MDRRGPCDFEARTKALIEQYNAFVPTQLQEKYADDPDQAPHVNGALTIGENIGDLGGVGIALKAYAIALDKAAGRENDGSPEALPSVGAAPVMDGFTGLQRFFLSYASIWRTTQRGRAGRTVAADRPALPRRVSAPTASPATWICSTQHSRSSPAIRL